MNQQSDSQPREHSGPRVTGDQMRDVDRLRRSTSDRYFAGVAGGLGRHFDVDPTIIRVLLVVLTFFGGAGALVYGAVWLFVPEDGRDKAPVDVTPDVRRVVLIVAAAIALMVVLGSPFFGNDWNWGFPIPLLVVGAIALVLFFTRDQWRSSTGGTPPPPPWGSTPPSAYSTQEGTTMPTTDTTSDQTSDTATYAATDPGQQPPAWMPPPAPGYVPPPRPRRTGLVLFWPTLALIAIGLGSLGIYDISSPVTISAYAALALTITGVMLLVGAFVGRPGGLIALGLAGGLALMVTSIVGAATGGEVDNRQIDVRPTTPAALAPSYHVSTGDIQIDLGSIRDLSALDGRSLDVRLNAGEITVLVPEGLNVDVNAEIRYAGEIRVGDEWTSGFDQSLNKTLFTSTASGTPTLDLEADARVGSITVQELP